MAELEHAAPAGASGGAAAKVPKGDAAEGVGVPKVGVTPGVPKEGVADAPNVSVAEAPKVGVGVLEDLPLSILSPSQRWASLRPQRRMLAQRWAGCRRR